MSKKPEKRPLLKPSTTEEDLKDPLLLFKSGETMGYNQAIDEYDKFLPNTPELLKIIDKKIDDNTVWKTVDFAGFRHDLATAISNRLRGDTKPEGLTNEK